MILEVFFDKTTCSFSYIISCQKTKKCAIIDSVLDFDPESDKFSSKSADKIINYIKNNNLKLDWILETHIHADHISAARYLKENLGGKIAISKNVQEISNYWSKIYNVNSDISNFDHLFINEEVFKIGDLTAKFIQTKGHTPTCSSFIINNHIFVGDLFFMPNLGVGRADFPGGDAEELFNSIQKIFSYPNDYKILTAHDYPENGQKERFLSTILEQKQNNIFAKIANKKEFIKKRQDRDKMLSEPKLLKYALKENIIAGGLVTNNDNIIVYL